MRRFLFTLLLILLPFQVFGAVTVNIYDGFQADLANKEVDWEADTIKVALLDSSHSFTASDDVWSDISANEVSGTGYTAGGETLANASVIEAATTLLDADNTSWASATFTAHYAVIYDTSNANSLMACIDFGTDETVSGGTFTLDWDDGTVADAVITFSD